MARPDITRKMLNDLHASYNGTIGAQPDLTTWMARKLAQSRSLSTTTVVLYDGDDLVDEVRTYLNALADTTTP
jgi:hypothetical protein